MSFGVISFVGLVVALSPQITNEKLFSEHTITRIELPHAPISRLQLDIPLGQLSDPSKKAGLAQITAETLRLELSDQFENLEVRVTPSSTALSLWLEPKMLAPSLGQLLSAITELSKRATLQESFKYARANVVQRQQRTGTNNKVLLDRGLQRLRLRTTAKPLFSRIAGMKECQLEDVKQRFQDWPKLRAIKIIVAGPDLGAVTAGAGKTLRQFVNEKDDPPKQATPTVSTEPISKQRRILVVDRPGQREVSAVLFQPRQSLSASWNLIARIANAGVSRLRYGAFGRTIRHHRGALEKMERSSPGLGISFRCAPDKLVRIVRDLDQRWLKTRDGGLPLADIEAGRQLEGQKSSTATQARGTWFE